MWVLFAGAATPWPSTSEASEEQPMETTGATENGHEAAPEGESPASTVTGAAAGAGGGNAAPPAGNQNGTEGDQINTSKNEEDAGSDMLEAGALVSPDLLYSSPVWPVQRWMAHRDYSSLDEVGTAHSPSSSRHGLSRTESTAGWRRLVPLDGPCRCFLLHLSS
ncbi:uncharacterized protein LOC130680390 isoform X5 [Manis pentadactyla]|uniref:uncharacterized protein LOC130680390 isoform X5 n=1 Tax=Manis pentadactyla TaxID=143292 RepID=UPI00255C696A|nr:uncharacterized protein LOC130680390 isoform X5 [Manis pentadactyla]